MVVGISNVNLPGGSLRGEENQFLIRTVNEFESVEEIAGLVLRRDGNSILRVGDVAEVRWGAREREEITRVGGVESVEISVYKEGDANIVTTARDVRERLPEIQALLPEGYQLTLLFDQSRFIEQAVSEVRSAALVGGLLAIIVLFAFLRDFRSHADHRHLHPAVDPGHLHRHVPHGRLAEHHESRRADPGHRHAGGQRHRGSGVDLPQA